MAPSTAHARKPASSAEGDDLISSLKQLARLRDSGVLTDKEFTAAKGKLLAR